MNSNEVTVEVNLRGHPEIEQWRLLLVTSDGRFLEVIVYSNNGRVTSLGGSIFPAEIPSVFNCYRHSGNSCVDLKREFVNRFRETVDSIRVPLGEGNGN